MGGVHTPSKAEERARRNAEKARQKARDVETMMSIHGFVACFPAVVTDTTKGAVDRSVAIIKKAGDELEFLAPDVAGALFRALHPKDNRRPQLSKALSYLFGDSAEQDAAATDAPHPTQELAYD